MKGSGFVENLLTWYSSNARPLPWRDVGDPYRVWISEIMLQQTRVETVIPYYLRWIGSFPSLPVLASASQQTVLAAWEGLGYYGRARNLHRAALEVVEKHGGQLPADIRLLRHLPGIGRYTAGAIASIAFGLDEPALDGNIRRVLARVFNVTEPARSVQGEHHLWRLAGENLPAGRAGAYNQALMDLGSMVCTPRSPLCSECPIRAACQAYALGVQEDRPVRLARPAVPHFTVTAAVIQKGEQILIAQRPLQGLLGGMWEFPGGKLQPGEDLPGCLQREICEELGVSIRVGGFLGEYHHAYTHYKVTLHAFLCTLSNGDEPHPLQVHDLRWVGRGDLEGFPMGKIDRQIAIKLMESG